MKLEEQNTDNESCPFVAIYERMVADDTGCVKSGHCHDVCIIGVGMVLAGTGKSGLQKPSVPQSRRAAVDGYKAVVDGQDIAFLNPERFFLCHFASAWSVLR